MKHTLSAVILALGLVCPALAGAQELGSKGDVIFSADRLMGITGTKHTIEQGPLPDAENDFTTVSFGWRMAPDGSPFDVPRLSFDYTLFDSFTLGGSLGYVSVDPDDGQDFSAFLLAVRAGYLHSFGRVVAIWPRGGITYHTWNLDDDFDASGMALTIECPFTFSPAQHFAFHVGPTFDIDIFGERDLAAAGDVDERYRAFGVNAGILGWF